MADLKSSYNLTDLKTNRLPHQPGLHRIHALRYQDVFDALIIHFVEPREDVIVHYVDDHVALLYEITSLEIIGLQIEAFEKSFLDQQPAVRRVWRLSDTDHHLENVGDLALVFEKIKPQVAGEVLRATQSVLGPPGHQLLAVYG